MQTEIHSHAQYTYSYRDTLTHTIYIQLEREPRPFPTLKISPNVRDIDSFKFSDLTIEGYEPHAKIAMDMAV